MKKVFLSSKNVILANISFISRGFVLTQGLKDSVFVFQFEFLVIAHDRIAQEGDVFHHTDHFVQFIGERHIRLRLQFQFRFLYSIVPEHGAVVKEQPFHGNAQFFIKSGDGVDGEHVVTPFIFAVGFPAAPQGLGHLVLAEAEMFANQV